MPMSMDPGNCITWQRVINRIEGVAGLQSLRSKFLDAGRKIMRQNEWEKKRQIIFQNERPSRRRINAVKLFLSGKGKS